MAAPNVKRGSGVIPDARQAFFLSAAEHEVAEADRRPLFSHKLGDVPDAILAHVQFKHHARVWRVWWREYLTLKYAALTMLNDKPRKQTRTLLAALGLCDTYREVVEFWRRLAERERRIYQLRVEQIGDVDRVKDTWYDTFESFDRWSASCLAKSDALEQTDGATIGAEDVRAFVTPVLTAAPTSDRAGLRAVAMLGVIQGTIADVLGNCTPHDIYPDGDGGVVPVDSVAVRVASETAELMRQGKHDLKDYIDVLLATVCAATSASVVDFLLRRRTEGGEQLELFATTAAVESEAWEDLEREAAYSRPIGITGSILVAERRHSLFHVGTNDLENDPRQSPQHRSAYERWYGTVVNFWVFPVFLDNDLLGALRVVNRLDEDEQIVPWSLVSRRRLLGLLHFAGRLWESCDVVIPVPPHRAPTDSVADHVAASRAEHLVRIRTLFAREEVSLLPEVGSAILDWAACQASIRIEDNRLGFLVGVIDDTRTAARSLIPTSAFYPQGRLPTIRELRGDPGSRIVIALREDGGMVGRFVLGHTETLDAKALSSQLGVDLVLECDSDLDQLVAIWRRARRIGEYAFLPRGGRWALRDVYEGQRQVQRKTSMAPEIVGEVFRRTIQMSNVTSGTLVLTPASSSLSVPISKDRRMNQALSTFKMREFGDLVHRDGATIIEDSGIVVGRGVTLPNERPPSLDNDQSARLREWEARLSSSDRGTRHEAALLASARYENAVAFCASENRTVCVFIDGEAVLWDF